MINNIVTKEEKQKMHLKDTTAQYMMEQLDIEARHREHELKVLDKLMKERSEIDVARCKGRY